MDPHQEVCEGIPANTCPRRIFEGSTYTKQSCRSRCRFFLKLECPQGQRHGFTVVGSDQLPSILAGIEVKVAGRNVYIKQDSAPARVWRQRLYLNLIRYAEARIGEGFRCIIRLYIDTNWEGSILVSVQFPLNYMHTNQAPCIPKL